MSTYQAPLQDIRFVLFDLLGAEALFQRLGRDDARRELLDAVLEEAARFTQSVLAPLNAIGDPHGCPLDPPTAAVPPPPGSRDAPLQFVAGGRRGLAAPAAYGDPPSAWRGAGEK